MCLCKHIFQSKQLDIIDQTLTPVNASRKGYRHIEDVPNIYKTLTDLLSFAEERGYKLGVSEGGDERSFGLYCKTNREKQRNYKDKV